MKLEMLLLMCVIMCCVGVRLSPMENNDKLQDINSLYVAEWQWESWPVKQGLTEQEERTPSRRKNVALWRDSSKSAWYLFGGSPVNADSRKVYSDIWKFTIKTRVWKKFFPSPEENANKKGSLVNTGISKQSNASQFEPTRQNIVLCGGLDKKNSTKNLNMWNTFKRNKFEEEKNNDRLAYLAVYAPKTAKASTIWQIEAKKKLWTAYICCCNITEDQEELETADSTEKLLNEETPKLSKISDKSMSATKSARSAFDLKINNAEDKEENEQQLLNFNNMKNKKKKINQMRKSNEKSHLKQIKIEKKAGSKKEKNMSETKPQGLAVDDENVQHNYENGTKINTESVKEEHDLKPKIMSGDSGKKPKIEKSDKILSFKSGGKYCPHFTERGPSVAWCDGKNEAFVTANIISSQIKLQVFNLSAGQWSPMEVLHDEGAWESCGNENSIRYAGNEEEVYMICSGTEKQSNASNKSLQDSTNPSGTPSKKNFNTKLVYRINYLERKLRSLGRILLNPYFNSLEGEKVWQNDTQSILEVFRNSENETILILAYENLVDIWILNKNQENKESFELTEKVWRGSALKWFDKYNAPLYSLQFVSDSGNSETILLPNPRNIEANEYWPRERGRFIIRVFRNENLKNQSFENRTRDQNLTYELLQSDYKPSGGEQQLNQMYSLKVLVFFGISIAIFTAFGFVIFLKRCVNCPPRIRIRSKCHKSPLVIRYSVIPDDLLYPVA